MSAGPAPSAKSATPAHPVAAPLSPGELVLLARRSHALAHAPYSDFPVGAAVVDDDGRVFAGVNVENASYGLTMCAERVAIFTAVAAGARRIVAVAVSARKLQPITPCGACRQVMAEFCAPDTPVYADAGDAGVAQWTVGALLPAAFDAAALPARTVE